MPGLLTRYLLFVIVTCGYLAAPASADEGPEPLDFTALPSDEKICDWLRKTSPTFEEAHAMVLKLPNVKEIKFVSVDRDEVAFSAIGVFFTGGNCEIRLSNRLQGAERVKTLAFEICNASFHEEHYQIDIGASQGFFTAREFALAHEIYEYEAWRLYHRCLLEWERQLGEGNVPAGMYYGAAAAKVADYRLPPLAAHLKHMETSGHLRHYLDWFEKHYAKRP